MRKAFLQSDKKTYKDQDGNGIQRQVTKHLDIGDEWEDEKGKWHKVISRESTPEGGLVVVSVSVEEV